MIKLKDFRFLFALSTGSSNVIQVLIVEGKMLRNSDGSSKPDIFETLSKNVYLGVQS